MSNVVNHPPASAVAPGIVTVEYEASVTLAFEINSEDKSKPFLCLSVFHFYDYSR